jgi:type VI protein secretion system component Hcp
MGHTSIKRFITASLCILAFSIIGASASFGALNAYLEIKSSDGKIYKATPDAGGKFTFTGVQPGSYELRLVASYEYFALKKKDADAHKGEIQLLSFSWGASNSGAISGSGNADRESGTPAVSEIVVTKSTDKSSPRVAAADVNGDGRADRAAPQKIREAKGISVQNPTQDGTEYYTIIMKNVIVTAACSASGTVSGIAITQPGVR